MYQLFYLYLLPATIAGSVAFFVVMLCNSVVGKLHWRTQRAWQILNFLFFCIPIGGDIAYCLEITPLQIGHCAAVCNRYCQANDPRGSDSATNSTRVRRKGTVNTRSAKPAGDFFRGYGWSELFGQWAFNGTDIFAFARN